MSRSDFAVEDHQKQPWPCRSHVKRQRCAGGRCCTLARVQRGENTRQPIAMGDRKPDAVSFLSARPSQSQSSGSCPLLLTTGSPRSLVLASGAKRWCGCGAQSCVISEDLTREHKGARLLLKVRGRNLTTDSGSGVHLRNMPLRVFERPL